MRGQILGVDARTGDGLVAGDDGQRYVFGPTDWAPKGEPAIGLPVDFETHANRAVNIFPLTTTPAVQPPARPVPMPAQTDRNKYVAALLAFFIGTFGIHRFYLGRNGSGVAMLILSLTVIGLVVSWPWSIVDTVRYLMMSDRDFARRYAKLDP